MLADPRPKRLGPSGARGQMAQHLRAALEACVERLWKHTHHTGALRASAMQWKIKIHLAHLP